MIYWNKCCGYIYPEFSLSKREMQFSDTQCSDKPFWASYYRILVQSNTMFQRALRFGSMRKTYKIILDDATIITETYILALQLHNYNIIKTYYNIL